MIIYGITQDYMAYCRRKLQSRFFTYDMVMNMLRMRYEERKSIKFLEKIVKEG